MDDDNVPVGFIVLNKLISGKSILKTSLFRIYFSFCFFIIGFIFLQSGFQIFSMFILMPSLCSLILFLVEFQRKKTIMTSIAVNLGHPWVEEEHDVYEAEVAYKTLEKWEKIPRKGRVIKNVEEKGLLIDSEDNELTFEISKPLLGANFKDKNNEKIESETIRWLNLALAIRDAQNQVEDEIENARIREDDDELDVERYWPEITPGELNVKPGAIFRKFSKVKK